MIRLSVLIWWAWATMAGAQVLEFSGNATLQTQRVTDPGSYALPTGPLQDGALPFDVREGRVTQQAWRIAAPSLTTLQLIRPLREQLLNDGYRILFECDTVACGGFDFRFALDILPAPNMRVNLGDFRYLAARRGGSDSDALHLGLMVSRTGQAGFVHLVHIGQEMPMPDIIEGPDADPGFGPALPSISTRLDRQGRAVLDDLRFDSGAAGLTPGDYPSLQSLADYLFDAPDARIALVGHTDTSGGLEANITLSERRAASVLTRLVDRYGIDRDRITAAGVGYLAPLTGNDTAQGQALNRRVEAVIIPPPR